MLYLINWLDNIVYWGNFELMWKDFEIMRKWNIIDCVVLLFDKVLIF